MTLKETEMAIEGEKVRGKELFEGLEAINHHNALLYMLEEIKPNYKIIEKFILKLHYREKASDCTGGPFSNEKINQRN